MSGVVHFLVPEGIDDPDRVSGGNIFDRHIRDGLARIGWEVQLTEVETDAASHAVLAGLPDGALVLIDGLVATDAPAAVETAAGRLRIVVLAHMVSAAFPDADPQGIDRERRALQAAHRVIATSEWTKRELVRRGLAAAERIDVATPGADEAAVSPGSPSGRALLCVGVVAPHKGQDTLVEALAALAAQPEWTCTIAGSLAARPDFADHITARARAAGVARPHHDGRRARPGRPRCRLPPGRPARRALSRGELRHGDRRGAAPRHPDRRVQRRRASRRPSRPRRRCSCRRISPPHCGRRWSTG